jgi:hydrogenase maturation protein HypF
LGGHLNVTFAVSRDKEIILSQHLGDLESYETRQVYERTLEDLLQIYDIQPEGVVHDLHPDYYTTELAAQFDLPQIAIQHHHAHLAACVLENQLEGSVLGLTWDGTGYGPDHTIWGGEILLGDSKEYQRVGSLCPFQLPGGERAIKEPWRIALSLLWESFGESLPRDLPLFSAFTSEKIEAIVEILKRSRLSPVTTSMGRLFDGVSALLGLSFYNTHQAQSAQLLEYAAWEFGTQAVPLPLPVQDQDILRLDWKELVRALVDEYRQGTPPQQLAAGFHQAVTRAAIEMAKRVAQPRVMLTGGVFCNRYLTENLLTHLEEEGFKGYIHSQLPPTDGSLAVGQLWAAAHGNTTEVGLFSQPGHSQSTRR